MDSMKSPAQKPSSIAARFEEVRQSFQLEESMREYRESQASRSECASQNVSQHYANEGNKKPHFNEEINKDPVIMDTCGQLIEDHGEITQQKHDAPIQNNAANVLGNFDEHRIPLSELFERFKSNPDKGLTQSQAEEYNKVQGDNQLKEKKKPSALWIFFLELTEGFSLMLWVGTLLCIICYIIDPSDPSNYYIAIILVVVILVTAIITFQQNKSSEALMDSFKNIIPSNCVVIRDGESKTIEAKKLVVGDIVKIKSGEKIPADIRLLQSNEMKVDNSALTGESKLQLRLVECTHPYNPLETANVAFFGSLCKDGSGRGVVIKIGEQTTLGKIADMASGSKHQKTPLRIEINRFIVMIAIISVVMGGLFFVLAWQVTKYPITSCLTLAIGILCTNVPEGLLGCITASLAITARLLHKKNVLVKNLEAVETLGSTSCICTDKTGTLTKNVMTVHNMWYNGQVVRAHNKLTPPNGGLQYNESEQGFSTLHRGAVNSTEARFDTSKIIDNSKINYQTCAAIGDATEVSIIRFYQSIEDLTITRGKTKFATNSESVEARMPFNSSFKYALSVVEEKTQYSDYCVYVKGAPEKIWKFCKFNFSNGHNREIDAEWEKKFQDVNLQFGRSGERVLGFAKLHLPRDKYPLGTHFTVSSPSKFNFETERFTFIGLISLIDPPKDTVPAAVLECRSAGIKVVMITGDQPPTAASIARQVNIIPQYVKTNDELMLENPKLSWFEAAKECKAIIVHGDRIVESLELEITQSKKKFTYLREWIKKDFCVFARTTPEQKLQIVQACQAEDYVCAVTGDGVNDSPAIKQADIGISMNLSGSDVTKDAADMILLDDDFSAIVHGVEEGRKIFDNIKKTTLYLLASNIPLIVPFLAFVIFRIPLPISNMFMLSVDAGTDIIPGLSLGYEDAEVDVMARMPRKKTDHLVSIRAITHSYALIGIFGSGSGFACYYTTMNYLGIPIGSLFGMANIYIYPTEPSETRYLKHYDESQPSWVEDENSVYYNKLIMRNIKDCKKDLELIDAEDSSERKQYQVDWITIDEGKKDLRQQLVYCDETMNRWRPMINYSYCDTHAETNISPVTDVSACYTAEAIKYGQTSWFIGVVIMQLSNVVLLKSRRASFTTTTFNRVMLFGQLFEICFCIFITQVPGVQDVFGARPLQFWQFGIPGACWSMSIMIWEETRKFLIRNTKWFEKFSFW